MALDPRKRQKKLAKQRARRKAKAAAQKRSRQGGSSSLLNAAMALEFELAARAPVYESYVAEEIFDQGMGYVIVSRRSGSGMIAIGTFLIDAYCLGVKDAFARLVTQREYEGFIDEVGGNVTLRRVEPAYAKKLVVGAVAYARDLGFEPHPDYKLPSKILADIDEMTSTAEFTFGKDGKPFYIAGPNDTEARSKQIIDTLHRRLGPDGYHYLMPLSPFGAFLDDDDNDWEDDDEEWEDDDEDEDEDEDEDVRRRRV
ncbi:MAG: hypothetical protein ACRD9Y_27175 [Blastocatellia bacterium]